MKIRSSCIRPGRFCRVALLALAAFGFSACDPGYNDASSWRYPNDSRDCRYYGNCGYNSGYYGGYGGGYDHDYDHHDRDHYDRDHDHNWQDHRPRDNNDHYPRPHHDRDEHHQGSVLAPAPTPAPVIRPSCPPNTTFDGRHCIQRPEDRRKGGKGTINACPNGMWLSNGVCVPNR